MFKLTFAKVNLGCKIVVLCRHVHVYITGQRSVGHIPILMNEKACLNI